MFEHNYYSIGCLVLGDFQIRIIEINKRFKIFYFTDSDYVNR